MELDDNRIVDAILQGDTESFSLLVERYGRLIYSICLKVLRLPDEAENAAQESFLKVYTSLGDFQRDEGGNLKAWLSTISYHTAVDLYRKQKRKRSYETDDIADWESLLSSKEPDALEQMIRQENQEKLLSILQELPEKYRVVLEEFYFKGKSQKVIALERGMAVKSVESQLYRARELIRKRWR